MSRRLCLQDVPQGHLYVLEVVPAFHLQMHDGARCLKKSRFLNIVPGGWPSTCVIRSPTMSPLASAGLPGKHSHNFLDVPGRVENNACAIEDHGLPPVGVSL